MASRKSLVEDMLTKMVKVFPSDIHILCNKYIIGGTKSEESTSGYFMCSISNKLKSEMEDTFDSKKVYYFNNIRTDKSDIDKNAIVLSDEESVAVAYKINYLNNIISNVEVWTPLLINEADREKLFDDNSSIELFSDNDEIPSLLLGKNMFPTLSEKTMDRLYYSYLGVKDDYNQVLFNINTDYFEIYMLYRYL